MNLNKAKSEAQKYSQAWGVTLCVFSDQNGRVGYARVNEIGSSCTILETYTPECALSNGISPESTVEKKKNFFQRLFNL